jgi:hypothetical protein
VKIGLDGEEWKVEDIFLKGWRVECSPLSYPAGGIRDLFSWLSQVGTKNQENTTDFFALLTCFRSISALLNTPQRFIHPSTFTRLSILSPYLKPQK